MDIIKNANANRRKVAIAAFAERRPGAFIEAHHNAYGVTANTTRGRFSLHERALVTEQGAINPQGWRVDLELGHGFGGILISGNGEAPADVWAQARAKLAEDRKTLVTVLAEIDQALED